MSSAECLDCALACFAILMQLFRLPVPLPRPVRGTGTLALIAFQTRFCPAVRTSDSRYSHELTVQLVEERPHPYLATHLYSPGIGSGVNSRRSSLLTLGTGTYLQPPPD